MKSRNTWLTNASEIQAADLIVIVQFIIVIPISGSVFHLSPSAISFHILCQQIT
ncbi:hypothetical protein AAFN87_02440 [Solibacillus sp. CAU 1738]